MAESDIISAILHYKKNIEKISTTSDRALRNEDRLLHCINKLLRIPVKVHHLQETGVGRTVNALRKIEGQKGLGHAARALVAKWKKMVLEEEELEAIKEAEATEASETETDRIKLIRQAELESEKTDSSDIRNGLVNSDKNRKRKAEYVPTVIKEKSRKQETSDSDDDLYDSEMHYSPTLSSHMKKDSKYSVAEYKPTEKSKSSKSESYSKDDIQSSSKHHSSDKKSSHKDDKSKNRHGESSKSSSKDKHSISKKVKEEHEKGHSTKGKSTADDGIDFMSGASFADALGPMVVKKSKKKTSTVSSGSLKTEPSPSTSTSIQNSPVKKNSSKPVDLLTSTKELEPLEPDLVATLPVPTPHYKPRPGNYNLLEDLSKRKITTEEDALINIMSNKNQRTKVFSGVKGGLTYVPTLYELCCRILTLHIDALEYTGGIPYSLLKPILDGATPSQLFQFEHFNPYIIEETDHLWQFHVGKEFRSGKRQEFESWREMYLRCLDEREEKYKAVTANIQKSIQQSVPVRQTKLAYVDIAKPPRNIARKQLKNGTAKPETAKLLGKLNPEAVRVPPPKAPTVREPSAMFKLKPKVAPLMQKTLKSIKMTHLKR